MVAGGPACSKAQCCRPGGGYTLPKDLCVVQSRRSQLLLQPLLVPAPALLQALLAEHQEALEGPLHLAVPHLCHPGSLETGTISHIATPQPPGVATAVRTGSARSRQLKVKQPSAGGLPR
ncbi:hypothetical protein WJX72_000508 [[Myrmecia] bisecta]|uniref:Uncharacterized protein n=1 Tax=[Myrmecia] bisecta TaxID=41462 RepID=A0AAW1PVG1_9CHLO